MPRITELESIREAALSQDPVEGLTHNFYRYPARFSPAFAAAAIEQFSQPGDLVFDPFVGGGTTAVEAMAAGRNVIATDVNSLAIFITRVKTTALTNEESKAVLRWAKRTAPKLHFRQPRELFSEFLEDRRTFNLTLARARPIKKAIAVGLANLDKLPSDQSRDFARCILLRTSQWALDNRKRQTPLVEYRRKIVENAATMVAAMQSLSQRLAQIEGRITCKLAEVNAAELPAHNQLGVVKGNVDLVVASPPYPGIHMLYHRWQVDGRHETPAPYWIANCNDGHGTSYYTFGDRRRGSLDFYFETLRKSLISIRQMMKDGAHIVQMVSFSDRQNHLRRYLYAMNHAGFAEVSNPSSRRRIWRDVPNRKWHATFKGQTNASKEVVLIHRAV
jgi:DNA modification methylase